MVDTLSFGDIVWCVDSMNDVISYVFIARLSDTVILVADIPEATTSPYSCDTKSLALYNLIDEMCDNGRGGTALRLFPFHVSNVFCSKEVAEDVSFRSRMSTHVPCKNKSCGCCSQLMDVCLDDEEDCQERILP